MEITAAQPNNTPIDIDSDMVTRAAMQHKIHKPERLTAGPETIHKQNQTKSLLLSLKGTSCTQECQEPDSAHPNKCPCEHFSSHRRNRACTFFAAARSRKTEGDDTAQHTRWIRGASRPARDWTSEDS